MSHTQEPWAVMGGAPWNVLDGTGRRLTWVHGSDYKGQSSAEDEANARRIVAAVNACAGIPTKELEAFNRAVPAPTPGGRVWVLEGKP